MAQLVARLHGMQKVRGSNPRSSTQLGNWALGLSMATVLESTTNRAARSPPRGGIRVQFAGNRSRNNAGVRQGAQDV